jgi:hypothetical protein
MAAELLEGALGEGYRITAVFVAVMGDIDRSAAPCIVVMSLLSQLDFLDEPWADQRRRLEALYGDLTGHPAVVAYVCTVFRHVAPTVDLEVRRRLLRRLRRLNLLAADLSRRTGVFVADIDRDLSDVGARSLATDHRLGGPFAAAVGGRCLAKVLLDTGLDAVVPYEDQMDAARALERLSAPTPRVVPRASTDAAPLAPAAPNWRSRGARSTAAPTRLEGGDVYARLLLRGEISPAQAVALVKRAVSRNGYAGTLMLAFRGMGRLWRSRGAGRR